ncbi:hypothetical protein AMTRI_Chr08g159910 [Amborella trichopoda]
MHGKKREIEEVIERWFLKKMLSLPCREYFKKCSFVIHPQTNINDTPYSFEAFRINISLSWPFLRERGGSVRNFKVMHKGERERVFLDLGDLFVLNSVEFSTKLSCHQ